MHISNRYNDEGMKRLEREKMRKRKTSMLMKMRSMLWVKVQILLLPLPFEGEGRSVGVCATCGDEVRRGYFIWSGRCVWLDQEQKEQIKG